MSYGDNDLSQFSMMDLFRLEAQGQTQALTDGLLAMERGAGSDATIESMMRAAHSIKGGAATFGFTGLTETTHLLETLLDRARHGQLRLSGPMIDAFLETKDALQDQLTAYQANREPDADRVAHICGVLQQLARENEAGAGSAPAAAPVPAPAPVVAEPPKARRTLWARLLGR